METVNSIIATHKRTWVGTALGITAGFFAAKKIIQTKNYWIYGISMIVGAVAGSVIQDKITPKKTIDKIVVKQED